MPALPIPSSQYFPKPYIDAKSQDFISLTNKLDSIYLGIISEVKNFRRTRRIEMMPRKLAEAYGHQVSAGILPSDNDRMVASKCYYATRSWKYRGTWSEDAKYKIDSIAGGNSKLIESGNISDSIIYGGLHSESNDNYWGTIGINTTSPEGYYFDTDTDDIIMSIDTDTDDSIIGTDGIDDFGPDIMASPYFVPSGDNNLGDDIIGSGLEMQIPGNVYIDVDNPFLSNEEIEKIVYLIRDTCVPAYFRVFLCYLNDSGIPIVYQGGLI